MFERFFPDLMVDKVQDIDFEILKKKGIRGLILDIDNTLVPQHMKDANESAVKWIESVKKAGLRVCIVSNASKKRVIRFNQRLQVETIHRAVKPSSKALLRATRTMGIKPTETAVIGDQIFTDIYGGNKLDMLTILVNPIDKREALIVRMKRNIEKIVLARHTKWHLDKDRMNRRMLWKKSSAARRMR